MYSIVLGSGAQQSDSFFFFRLFSIRGYYKILNIVLCVLHRSSHLSSQQQYVLNTFYPCFLDTEIRINNWLESLPPDHIESK